MNITFDTTYMDPNEIAQWLAIVVISLMAAWRGWRER
jgi:hypothetical protein